MCHRRKGIHVQATVENGIFTVSVNFCVLPLDFLLAHLSRRITGGLIGYVGLRRLSSVVRHRPHSLNIISSETVGPIKVKFHMELLWDRGTKVCSNGPGHMTKMAAMSIYGKNLKTIVFPRTKRPTAVKLGMRHRVREYYQIYSKMTLFWPWPILRQGQICPLCFYMGKKVK